MCTCNNNQTPLPLDLSRLEADGPHMPLVPQSIKDELADQIRIPNVPIVREVWATAEPVVREAVAIRNGASAYQRTKQRPTAALLGEAVRARRGRGKRDMRFR